MLPALKILRDLQYKIRTAEDSAELHDALKTAVDGWCEIFFKPCSKLPVARSRLR